MRFSRDHGHVLLAVPVQVPNGRCLIANRKRNLECALVGAVGLAHQDRHLAPHVTDCSKVSFPILVEVPGRQVADAIDAEALRLAKVAIAEAVEQGNSRGPHAQSQIELPIGVIVQGLDGMGIITHWVLSHREVPGAIPGENGNGAQVVVRRGEVQAPVLVPVPNGNPARGFCLRQSAGRGEIPVPRVSNEVCGGGWVRYDQVIVLITIKVSSAGEVAPVSHAEGEGLPIGAVGWVLKEHQREVGAIDRDQVGLPILVEVPGVDHHGARDLWDGHRPFKSRLPGDGSRDGKQDGSSGSRHASIRREHNVSSTGLAVRSRPL